MAPSPTPTTYYYVLASEKFLTEIEPLEEVLRERTRHYQEKGKEIDFFLVKRPAFLEAPELAEVKAKCPQPAAAVVTTNREFATFLKLRLEFVLTGSFTAPSASIPDPLASV
ncbi:MgPME-cyclase complex family protein [Gloeomargarita sp.]